VRASEVDIERVALTNSLAAEQLALAEAELDRRYGPGTDAEGLEPASFNPPLGAFLVATIDGRAVGCVGLRTVGPGIGEIKRLYVDGSLRRRGLARALMEAIEAEGAALGLELLELETGPLQPEAVALYLAEGWREVDELPVRVSHYSRAVRFVKAYPASARS
jgi:GNAT superfamily N-acetyltransferase